MSVQGELFRLEPFPSEPRSAAPFSAPLPPVDVHKVIEADIAREAEAVERAAMWDKLRRAAAAKVDQERREAPGACSADWNWLHDQGFFEGPEVAAEISDQDRAFAFSAFGQYLAICKERTGECVPEEDSVRVRAASKELLRQSFDIADRMAAAGFDAYRNTPFALWRYYVHSRHVERLPNFRRVMFIPHVAAQCRAPMLSALEFFLERHVAPRPRFWTFTTGVRVRLSGIRDRAKWLHRQLSLLNAQPFMKEAGAEIVFRSTELGTPETDQYGNRVDGGEIEYDEHGQSYFHVHAHCAVVFDRFLKPAEMSALATKVQAFWPYWFHDDKGGVRDARECCKYVTKPGEMLKLSGAELVELQAQLSRLKLVQPMGALAEEIKEREGFVREASGKWSDAPVNPPRRLVKKRTPEGLVFREVKNWNRHGRRTKTEAAAERVAKLTAKRVGNAAARIVARLTPGFGPSGIVEPRIVVMATHWDENAVRARPEVAQLIRLTAHEWRAGQILKVHVCTPTVGETRSLGLAETLPPPRHVPTGAELAGLSR